MYDGCDNIYRYYRESAGYTKEKAAELLDISVSSLSNYERFMFGMDRFKCPGEVVLKMEKVYGSQALAWRHLSEHDVVGRAILPRIEEASLSKAFLKLMIEQDGVELLEGKLARIASGEAIGPNEALFFNKAVNEIWEMVQAGISFIYTGSVVKGGRSEYY